MATTDRKGGIEELKNTLALSFGVPLSTVVTDALDRKITSKLNNTKDFVRGGSVGQNLLNTVKNALGYKELGGKPWITPALKDKQLGAEIAFNQNFGKLKNFGGNRKLLPGLLAGPAGGLARGGIFGAGALAGALGADDSTLGALGTVGAATTLPKWNRVIRDSLQLNKIIGGSGLATPRYARLLAARSIPGAIASTALPLLPYLSRKLPKRSKEASTTSSIIDSATSPPLQEVITSPTTPPVPPAKSLENASNKEEVQIALDKIKSLLTNVSATL